MGGCKIPLLENRVNTSGWPPSTHCCQIVVVIFTIHLFFCFYVTIPGCKGKKKNKLLRSFGFRPYLPFPSLLIFTFFMFESLCDLLDPWLNLSASYSQFPRKSHGQWDIFISYLSGSLLPLEIVSSIMHQTFSC